MTSARHHDLLWRKAQVFLNRAMDDDKTSSWDEAMLWGALALELLGKAALSKVNPALVADVTTEGRELLKATGAISGASVDFKTVSASTVFKRCATVFPPFNDGEAIKVAEARNEYLHGSGVGFGRIPNDLWWQKFWALATQLVIAQDRQLGDLLGDRESQVLAALTQNQSRLQETWDALKSAATRRLERHRSQTMDLREKQAWDRWRDHSTWGHIHTHFEVCPACGGDGTLGGDTVFDERESFDYDEDGYPTRSVTGEVSTEYFTCTRCHLEVAEDLIETAGLPRSFEVELDPSDYLEPEYGND